MKRCKRCVMPDTRPGIGFNEEGLCAACVSYERRKTIDWDARWEQLKKLCDKYRGCNGDDYDCAIAVSGGKDSHFQVHVIKDLMGMNPLLLSVSNYGWTETGRRNITNISEAFGCDIISFSPNAHTFRVLAKKALIELGSPTWYADAAIYAFPYRMAIKLGLKLLVYGENASYEYGGYQKEETYSALKQFENDVVKPIDFSKWLGDGITMKDLASVKNPTYEELKEAELEPVYLSYFIPWDSHHHYEVAKRFGFHHLAHEWVREGTIEQYNQIDSADYLINQWFKYPKYGHASATEMASRWIRSGRMTREEAIPIVKKYDKHLDQHILDEYLKVAGMSHREFWDIADKWYNLELFEKDKFGVWEREIRTEVTNYKGETHARLQSLEKASYKKMENKIVAIIPARGGSKGIPRKNIRLLLGKPLIVYSIEAALKSKYIDKVVVSTEDAEIAEISKKYRVEVIKRPDELARDDSLILDTIKHVLETLNDNEIYIPEVIVLLQPTSPLRTVKTIDLAISTFYASFEYYDSLIPLYPTEGKIGIVKKGNYIPHYVLESRRQDIEPSYRECGTIFIFKHDLIKNGEMYGEKIYPFIIKNYEESIDIDTIDDLKQAEYFMVLKNEE